MKQSGKQTDIPAKPVNKQSEQSELSDKKASSRVVDMSWAADYLDDTWENEHASKGAYDTQVLPPLKKYLQSGASGVNSLSSTQEFKALPGDRTGDTTEIGDIAMREGSFAEDDDLHIVDAVTDRTIAAKEEVQEVRGAFREAREWDQPEKEEDDLKIRDALTDQTVASVEEARAVRKAAAFFDLREDLDGREGIRDALSGKSFGNQQSASYSGDVQTPAFMSRKPVQPIPEVKKPEPEPMPVPALKWEPEPKPKPEQKTEREPEPEKTIVASKEVTDVRKAASSRFRLEELFREDDADLDPDEDDLYDQYEDIDDIGDIDANNRFRARDGYRRPENAGGVDGYDDYDDYDYNRPEGPDRYDDTGDFEEPGDYDERDRFHDLNELDEPDDYYDEYERPRKRSSRRYYYGYEQPRSPLRFIPLVLVLAICVLGFIVAMQICHDVPLNASDYSKVKYTVQDGLTDEQLSEDLQALGIIDNPLVFRLRCMFYSADYVPGTYELSPCYSTEKIINILSGYTYGTDD